MRFPRCRQMAKAFLPLLIQLLVPPNQSDYDPTMLDWNQCTVVEPAPDKVSGVWLFKGTRVPIKALFENLEAAPVWTISCSGFRA
jgi:hypothetical protein